MKEISTHFSRYLFGALTGMILLIFTYWVYGGSLRSEEGNPQLNSVRKKKMSILKDKADSLNLITDTNNFKNRISAIESKLNSLDSQIAATGSLEKRIDVIEEKMSSLNSRFNDFYIFAGIIITLLLAINVGVFIRTDHEVERHMNENYQKYAQKIGETLAEAEKSLGQIKAIEKLSSDIGANKSKSPQVNPPS